MAGPRPRGGYLADFSSLECGLILPFGPRRHHGKQPRPVRGLRVCIGLIDAPKAAIVSRPKFWTDDRRAAGDAPGA
jgi:hypothetical protein